MAILSRPPTKTKQHKLLLWSLFIFACSCLFTVLVSQNVLFNISPSEKANKNYLTLTKATATSMLCEDSKPCREYGDGQEITLPRSTNLNSLSTGITKLELKLNNAQIDWVSLHSEIMIYLPRFVHQRTIILQEPQNKSLIGYGADLYTLLNKQQILQSATIQMIIDHQNLPWFGPADFPIYLTNARGLSVLQDLRGHLLSRSLLTRQVQIAIPILVLLISLLFYHSRVFVYLGIFAAVLALRTALAHFFDLSGYSNIASFFYISTNIVSSLLPPIIGISLIKGSLINIDHKWLRVHFFSLIIGLCVSYYFGYFLESADLISDGCGGLFTLFAMTSIKGHKKSPHLKEERLALWIIQLVSTLTFMTNSYELTNLMGSNLKPWFLFNFNLLLPGFLIATFIYKGFVLTQIINYFKKQKRMDAINQNLETAIKFQKSILPERKHVSQQVSWRTYFKPSLVVSGDWFFIENLKFSDKKEQTFAIIIDVAGKGSHASMLSTYLAGETHNYLRHITQMTSPQLRNDKEQFFKELVNSLRSRLFADNPYFDFSIAAALIDHRNKLLSYVSCGHPGLMYIQNGASQYLSPTGSRINNISGQISVSHLDISPKSEIYLVSDGLIPQSISTPLYLQKTYKKSIENDQSYLMELVGNYKSEWKRKRRTGKLADDAACISIHFGTHT